MRSVEWLRVGGGERVVERRDEPRDGRQHRCVCRSLAPREILWMALEDYGAVLVLAACGGLLRLLVISTSTALLEAFWSWLRAGCFLREGCCGRVQTVRRLHPDLTLLLSGQPGRRRRVLSTRTCFIVTGVCADRNPRNPLPPASAIEMRTRRFPHTGSVFLSQRIVNLSISRAEQRDR